MTLVAYGLIEVPVKNTIQFSNEENSSTLRLHVIFLKHPALQITTQKRATNV